MDPIYASALAEMGISLSTLVVKGSINTVNNKIKAIKEEKSLEKVRNTYDEIINELISEREEAVRIAQAYKSELERVVISDKDIEHLHNTVSRILEIIKAFQMISASQKGQGEVDKINNQVQGYEQLKELISVDTLKTMQLLGFNYKAAIGEPLTEICAAAINSLVKDKNMGKSKNK